MGHCNKGILFTIYIGCKNTAKKVLEKNEKQFYLFDIRNIVMRNTKWI